MGVAKKTRKFGAVRIISSSPTLTSSILTPPGQTSYRLQRCQTEEECCEGRGRSKEEGEGEPSCPRSVCCHCYCVPRSNTPLTLLPDLKFLPPYSSNTIRPSSHHIMSWLITNFLSHTVQRKLELVSFRLLFNPSSYPLPKHTEQVLTLSSWKP